MREEHQITNYGRVVIGIVPLTCRHCRLEYTDLS